MDSKNYNTSGLLACARYAFPPNALHYCGPEQQANLTAYLEEGLTDQGLVDIIKDFQTLYPYLYLIAHENDIQDPFDPRVIEAYWIGNDLLKKVSMSKFYDHFSDALNLKKRLKKKDFDLVVGKLPDGILPHHSYHVLNVFTRTGHHTVEHTLDTMDKCRISWGTVLKPKSLETKLHELIVKTKPLVLENGILTMGKPVVKTISMPYGNTDKSGVLNPKSIVTFHWDSFCSTITPYQAGQLELYTNQAITLANKTL